MKWGILRFINSYKIVPSLMSVSIHAGLLWFLALCLNNGAGRKSAKSSVAAVAYFKKSHIHVPKLVFGPAHRAENQKSSAAHNPIKITKKAADGDEVRPALGASLLSDSNGLVEHGDTASNDRDLLRPRPELVNGDQIHIPYPERARQLMIEGVVRLRLTISEAGRVIDAEVLSGPAFGLRNAALLVARKLFFLPATDEYGQAKTAHVEHDVVFKLKRS